MGGSSLPRANVIYLDDLDSTAALAERLMAAWLEKEEDRLPETLLVAGTQREGRGRGENDWESPAGGLYANWLAWLPSGELANVPMAVGVTLAAAVESLFPAARVGLKWPNDLFVKGEKLGGILCHSRGSGEFLWVSVGFGVNIGAEPSLAAEGQTRAVSLRALGWNGDVQEGVRALAAAFLENVHAALADREGTWKRWVERSIHRSGDAIRLRLEGGVVEGRFVGFDRDCRLELEVGGEIRRYSIGEVLFGEGSGGT